MMKEIIIFGAGGFGREVLQIILDINQLKAEWNFKGFVVEPEYLYEKSVHGYPVYSELTAFRRNVYIVVAIGNPAQKWKVIDKLKTAGYTNFATLVHPQAWLGNGVKIGPGSIICCGALMTTDIYLGCHVHVNIGATVGHDSSLGNYSTVNPKVNLSGGVILEEGVEIGAGAVIIPQRTVGAWSILGAGSVVIKDVPANVTSVGSPATVIKTRQPGWHLQV